MIDLLGLAGPASAAVGTFGLVFLGRMLLRAQAIASVLRLLGLLTIGIGILATLGVVDVDGARLLDLARMVVDAGRLGVKAFG